MQNRVDDHSCILTKRDKVVPIVVGIVSNADHYLFCGARDYLGIRGDLVVELLERPMSLEGYVFKN